MDVEFKGGSWDGTIRRIERFFEYINVGTEVYLARAIHYKQLNWVYVWYEFSGSYQSEMING